MHGRGCRRESSLGTGKSFYYFGLGSASFPELVVLVSVITSGCLNTEDRPNVVSESGTRNKSTVKDGRITMINASGEMKSKGFYTLDISIFMSVE